MARRCSDRRRRLRLRLCEGWWDLERRGRRGCPRRLRRWYVRGPYRAILRARYGPQQMDLFGGA